MLTLKTNTYIYMCYYVIRINKLEIETVIMQKSIGQKKRRGKSKNYFKLKLKVIMGNKYEKWGIVLCEDLELV